MQLKSIKLSGFKSFPETTILEFKHPICAVVGPNGCGKSNIVDAIRWVVGEGSAKQLRMQSMAEVIFNGTNTRPPLGMASVELNFDNSDHSLVGEYAHYTDLSIRRSVERDGASSYFINNTPCRRRDIIDIFLGTGLGPRSYAVIEQGMISRLIEAKEQELRSYLEEAAGVSKYKERRRETETRIRHTNENLERLNDIIEEHAKQQRHLKRQANAAERYKILKAEQRQLTAQCLAIECAGFASEVANFDAQIAEQETKIAVEKARSGTFENEILQLRDTVVNSQNSMQDIQKRFYTIGSEIAKLEQQITHYNDQQGEMQSNLTQLLEQQTQLESARDEYKEQLVVLNSDLENLQQQRPESVVTFDSCRAEQQIAEQNCEQWRERWEQYQSTVADKQRLISVNEANTRHATADLQRLQQQCQQFSEIIARGAKSELVARINTGTAMQEELEADTDASINRCEELRSEIDFAREEIDTKQEQLNILQQQQQTTTARLQALEVIQNNSINQEHQEWLQENGLESKPRLTQLLQVRGGWEQAIEMVLAQKLSSICVQNSIDFKDQLAANENLSIYTTDNIVTSQAGTLAACVQSDLIPVELNSVFIADSVAAAWQMLGDLQEHESVITTDCLWLSKHWARSFNQRDMKKSQLLCAKEVKSLQSNLPGLEQSITDCKLDIEQATAKMRELDASREDAYQQSRLQSDKLVKVNANLSRLQAEQEETERAVSAATTALNACRQEISAVDIESLQTIVSAATSEIQTLESQKQDYQDEWQQLKAKQTSTTQDTERLKQSVDEFDLRIVAINDQLQLLQQMAQRDSKQCIDLEQRSVSLRNRLSATDSPVPEYRAKLQVAIEQRLVVESELTAIEAAISECNTRLKEFENSKASCIRILETLSNGGQQLQMARQEQVVRQATIKEQLQDYSVDSTQLLAELPDDATLSSWRERLEVKEKSISRLGPINMAAIDEYDAVTERKEHLDVQCADLHEALQLLQQAITKIDRETKDKFKQTFIAVNENLQRFFPKVFNGGRAYLELTEPDWLTAGVIIRAQPPGKKNSTIHMLSGGEKALTAIALVFSLFALTPAPFCVLDEVDAPLDDSNVARFCNLVQEMALKTQFIVVSHNKVSINIAQQLLGITMQEPGVSRIVVVDMQQAVAMAEV